MNDILRCCNTRSNKKLNATLFLQKKCQRVGEIGGGPKSPKGAKIGESKKRALFNQSRDLQKPGAQMKMSPRTKKQSSK